MTMISLRLMSEQLERLDKVAEARGLGRSDTLRRLIDEASLSPEERHRLPVPEELLALLGERARAGNVAAIRVLLERSERARRDAGVDDEVSPFDALHALGDGEVSEFENLMP